MFIDSMGNALTELILNNVPTMVWGGAGIGKSSLISQIAKKISKEYECSFECIDIRLSQLEPSDLRGILYPNPETNQAVWLPPSMLPSDPEWSGIIVLDELSSASPMIQAAAYQLILDRKIGDYTLPENAAIVGAGNRESDKGVVFKMAAPLANRMIHLYLDVSFEKWKPWAYKNSIKESIIGFLGFREDLLHKFDGNSKSKAFPSPRTWEYVSKVMDFNLQDEVKREIVFGTVGEGAGLDYWAYQELLSGAISTTDILDMSKDYTLPDDISITYGINSSLVYYLNKNKKNITKDTILALYRYMGKIKRDEVRVATFKEFVGNKIPIIGNKNEEVKAAFETFYKDVKDLIPLMS
jgi:hypothetical protein